MTFFLVFYLSSYIGAVKVRQFSTWGGGVVSGSKVNAVGTLGVKSKNVSELFILTGKTWKKIEEKRKFVCETKLFSPNV